MRSITHALRATARLATRPAVQLSAGVLMVAAAAWTVLEFESTGEDVRGLEGVLVLGSFIAIRALALVLEGVSLIGESSAGVAIHWRFVRRLRNAIAHPWFELLTAFSLLALGGVEGWEVLAEGGGEAGLGWCAALVAVGVPMFARSTLGLVQGARFLERAERDSGHSSPLLHRADAFLRRPQVEMGIGALILVVVLLEWFALGSAEDVERTEVGVGGTLALYGLARILRAFPAAFEGLELIAEGGTESTE